RGLDVARLARDPELVRRHRLDAVLRCQLSALHRDVEARLDDLAHAGRRPSRPEWRARGPCFLHRTGLTDVRRTGRGGFDFGAVGALLVDDSGPRLRNNVLALFEGEAAVLLLNDFRLALGPPFGDAGALNERVFDDGVEVQETRVVVFPDVGDIVLRLLGHLNVSLGARREQAGVLLGCELPDK